MVLSGCEGLAGDVAEPDELTEAWAQLGAGGRIAVQGTVEAFGFDEFDAQAYRQEFFVTDATSGRRLRLDTPAAARLAQLSTGMTVRVSGALQEGSLAVGAQDEVTVTGAAGPAAATQRSALAIRVNFTDGTVGCSETAVGDLMSSGLKNVGGWFVENSFGAMGFTTQVVTVSINRPVGTCDYSAWAADADAAATAAGINLGNFQHRIYVLPSNVACSWAGLGNLGCGSSCRAWIKTCQYPDVYAHELGHNISLHHASTDTNNDGVSDSEYGDTSDLMGYGGVGYRHTNAFHKLQLSWLPTSKATSATTGTYQLAPLEVLPSSTSSLQALKIPKADSPGVTYSVSYRRAVGDYSSNLSSSYADRVSIHRNSSGSSYTYLITTLGDGASWTDPVNGITITQSAHDASAATVTLSVTCGTNAPAISFGATSASRPEVSGSTTVTVSNRDSAGCGTSTFALAPVAPSGWTASLSATSLQLDPGQSGTVTFTSTPPAGTSDGSYGLSLSVTDGAVAAHTASGTGAHLVDSTPPSPVTTLAGSNSRNKIILTWGIPSDGSGTGVGTYQVRRNGVVLGTVATTSYVDSQVQSGVAYQYDVLATDRAGNTSAPGNTVTVTPRKGNKR